MSLHCQVQKVQQYNVKETFVFNLRVLGSLTWAYSNIHHFYNTTNSDGSMLDLINYPNLIMTKMDPPLSILASLWFYMTPGSGVPSMHDVLIGNWAGQGKV